MRTITALLLLSAPANANEASAVIHATATLLSSTTVETDGGWVRWDSNDSDAMPVTVTVTVGTESVIIRPEKGQWTDTVSEALALLHKGRTERVARLR